MAREKAQTIKHESYGMISLSRWQQSSETVLFGSSIKHRNTISITIREAKHTRDLNNDWYSADKELIEIEMSQSQFAEWITTPNVGFGVPCTIRRVNQIRREDPPFESKAATCRDEFEREMRKAAEGDTLYMQDALDILENKTSISKGDRETIKKAMKYLRAKITSTLPFIHEQFHEQMDKTITEAKAEIEAFVEHKVRTVGLEAIRDQRPELPEASEASKVTQAGSESSGE